MMLEIKTDPLNNNHDIDRWINLQKPFCRILTLSFKSDLADTTGRFAIKAIIPYTKNVGKKSFGEGVGELCSKLKVFWAKIY